MATQTGLQVANGKATSVDEEFNQDEKSPTENKKRIGGSPVAAPLVGLAFLAIFTAVACSVIFPFKGFQILERLSLMLPSFALALLLLQMIVEFPAKKNIQESIAQGAIDNASLDNPFYGMGNSMAIAKMSAIQIKIRPAFYIELVTLGIPALMLAGNFMRRGKKNTCSTAPLPYSSFP